jgi:hypothetical protein
LTLDEYGDRSARATHAQTRGDLAALFADLPEPHPALGDASVVPAAPADLAVRSGRTPVRRAVMVSQSLMWAVGVPLLFILGGATYWWLIFLPIAVSIIAGQFHGDSEGSDDAPPECRRRELE